VDSNHRFLQARDAFDASAPVRAPMDAPLRTGENEVIAGAVASPFIFSVSISSPACWAVLMPEGSSRSGRKHERALERCRLHPLDPGPF